MTPPLEKTRSRCVASRSICLASSAASEQPSGKPLELRGDATYLVTGGLGAIGLEIAGYLAANGAGQLVLTSRRAPGDATQRRVDALAAQHGCEIRVVTADVADAHDVARLLAGIQAELPPLAGIVHAAGEIGTTPLSGLDDAEVDRVFAGKVWGAWHLAEAATDLQLDFFVSTSSIASVWGGFGQTAYAAANAFLDGLAARLRARGVPATSVNFGPWSAGMADAESRARLEQRGVRTLSPADALAGLVDVVAAASAGGPAHGVVARIDWARFLPLYQQAGRRAFLAELEARSSRRAHGNTGRDGHREDASWSNGSSTPRCSSAGDCSPTTCATRSPRSRWSTPPPRSARTPGSSTSAWIRSWPWRCGGASRQGSARKSPSPW